ncbi:MAG: hypothetical protein HY905_27535 [Deltaproteobacteria bacterium]|nr:hypothetical protein [Deltaproteobacteria bacterium]
MTTRLEGWSLDENVVVIGALGPWTTGASFGRQDAVVRRGQEMMVVRNAPDRTTLQGSPVASEEWRRLVKGDQALEFVQPVRAPGFPAVWLFEAALGPDRLAGLLRELEAAAFFFGRQDGPSGTVACVVSEEPSALLLRSQWSSRTLARASRFAARRDWNDAAREADHAVDFGCQWEPAAWALRFLALRELGRATLAQRELAMVRNSRGGEFAEAVEQQVKTLRSRLLPRLARARESLRTANRPAVSEAA